MKRMIFIGTQGSGPGQGVFAATLEEECGTLALIGLAAEVERPTWLHADPGRAILFAVSEVGNAGDRDGAVLSFAVDGAALRTIARTGSGGGGATHLALDTDGGTLFVANFGGGQAATIPVAADGTLGPVASLRAGTGSGPHRRQQGPHPHGVTLDPSRRFLLVPDMGADRVFIYRYDAKACAIGPAEDAMQVPPGAGPRLLLFGADGRFAYLLTELSAELFVYRWHGAGRLTYAATTALDAVEKDAPRSAAALVLSADGRFLYASNRTTHEIHAFVVDRESGLLRETQRIAAGGEKPWAAAISPSGRWLIVANQGSDTVAAFEIDPATGCLRAAGEPLRVPMPTSIAFTD